MAQLRQDYDKFQESDTEVVVVGPEGQDAFANYWQKESLPYVGVPDPKHSVLKLYGQEIKIFKFGRMPAQTIVDKEGTVRFVHYGHSMQDIPKNEEVLEILADLNSKN